MHQLYRDKEKFVSIVFVDLFFQDFCREYEGCKEFYL